MCLKVVIPYVAVFTQVLLNPHPRQYKKVAKFHREFYISVNLNKKWKKSLSFTNLYNM